MNPLAILFVLTLNLSNLCVWVGPATAALVDNPKSTQREATLQIEIAMVFRTRN